jgi:hypothetical protein
MVVETGDFLWIKRIDRYARSGVVELGDEYWGDEYRPSIPLNPLQHSCPPRLEIISVEGKSRDQLGNSSWTNDGAPHTAPYLAWGPAGLHQGSGQLSHPFTFQPSTVSAQFAASRLPRQRYPGKKSAKPDRSPIRRSTCSLRWRASRSHYSFPGDNL